MTATLAPTQASTAQAPAWLFEDGLADTLDRLQHELVPPSVVTVLPLHTWGSPYDRHTGKTALVVPRVKEATAALLDAHLQAMRAAFKRGTGKQPFFDLNHGGVCVGHPLKFLWSKACGIQALVEWLDPAGAAILTGECNSFSPELAFNAKDEVTGLPLCSGALLSRSTRPAFSKMPAIRPITGWRRMQDEATLFLTLAGAQVITRPDSPEAQAALQAVRAEFPCIYRSHELREAIIANRAEDARLRP